jgi:hypothetical protein
MASFHWIAISRSIEGIGSAADEEFTERTRCLAGMTIDTGGTLDGSLHELKAPHIVITAVVASWAWVISAARGTHAVLYYYMIVLSVVPCPAFQFSRGRGLFWKDNAGEKSRRNLKMGEDFN